MPQYVDGFVVTVPKKNLRVYLKIARRFARAYIRYGALEVRECVAADLKTECGISFTQLTKSQKNDTVVFSWIVYRSKSHRNRVNRKMMQDKRIQKDMKPENLPFDLNNMTYGGFASRIAKFKGKR